MPGYVDFIGHIVVSGWAIAADGDAPAEVEVYADGVLVGQGLADRFRPDLKKHHIRDGKAGFQILLQLPLSEAAIEVSVRLKSDPSELANSPQTLSPALAKSPQAYQEEVRVWLNQRFGPDGWEDGVFRAHQPIYGFKAGYCESAWGIRYLITHHLMRELSHLDFHTLIDIGGAEGYKPALAQKLFGCEVLSCDLSSEACRRAEEIYHIPTQQVDIHDLPFEADSFDVVVASETIEHVIDYRQALTELLRIARKAVVITVPHEPIEQVSENISRGHLHGHIHHFDLHTFDYLQDDVEVHAKQIVSFSPWTWKPGTWMEANMHQPANWHSLGGISTQVLRNTVFSLRSTAAFLSLDALMLRLDPRAGYGGILFTLLKDPSCLRQRPSHRVSMQDVLSFQVPLHKRERYSATSV